MNKQKIILTLFVIVAAVSSVILVTGEMVSANTANTGESTIGYTLQVPDDNIKVKQGETVNIPVKLLTDTEKSLNVKLSVTEFTEYPEGRASLEDQVFTRGITASLSETQIHKANGIVKDESVNVTFTASTTAELGDRVLAITLLEGSYPNQSFVQTFVHVTIVE